VGVGAAMVTFVPSVSSCNFTWTGTDTPGNGKTGDGKWCG